MKTTKAKTSLQLFKEFLKESNKPRKPVNPFDKLTKPQYTTLRSAMREYYKSFNIKTNENENSS